ncbi:MAG: endonuclease MutS2 [Ignavibacteria bacterium]|nr:endonuclease MutS2 [Ignavibacteria bacterium]
MLKSIEKLDLPKIFSHVKKYASTEVGANLIENDFIANSLAEAELYQTLTDEAKRYFELSSDLEILFLPDLTEQIVKSRIEGFILNAKDFLKINDLLRNSRIIKNTFSENNLNLENLRQLSEELIVDKLLEKRINDVIDDYGEIKDNAGPELRRIRAEIKQQSDYLRKVADKLLKTFAEKGLVQEELMTIRDGRIVIPVKTEYKRQVKGFIHSESATGLTTYIEPEETLELNNELLSLHFEEKREISRILHLLTTEVSKIATQLVESLKLIAKFDSIFAKAKYSIEVRGTKVNFSNDHSFELLECRHPLLIQTIGYQKTVPFNLKLDETIKCMVISGPNAGGKTVLMKAIGVISHLARYGYHVPMQADSTIPFFKNIQIDIGDEQSIDNDISTFGSHLKSIKEIYNSSNDESLVLLDEIGTGTDPSEGVSLAAGILKLLIEKGSFIIVTTHHSYLKLFAANHSNAINASMEFNAKNLEPTYKFIQGIPGSSYAFEISERLNFPDEIIHTSKSFREKNAAEIEQYISSLHQKLQVYSKLLEEVKAEKIQLDKLINEFNQKLNEVKATKSEIKQKALEEALTIVKSANSLIEKTVKSIKESKADSNVIHQYREQIKTVKNDIEAQIVESSIPIEAGSISVGDFVISKEKNIKGRVIEIDERKNFVQLLIGNLKVKTKLNTLVKINVEKELEITSKVFNLRNEIIPMRLDIRGQRTVDAEREVLNFIDNASVSGLILLEILHGKGDGILKNFVKEWLTKHPFVESFNPAPIEQGGDGITIVKLKE